MDEDSPRKASDILLELESKINIIFQHLQNIDSNIKLILNRSANNIQKSVDSNLLIQLNSPQIIENNVNLSSKNEASSKIEEKDDEFIFVEPTNSTLNSARKVAVQQRVLYADGKNICLASVEIKDVKGITIKKMRTNAMGKWISSLDPGQYFVQIRKAATKSNPDVEMNFPISIQESDRPIELSPAKV